MEPEQIITLFDLIWFETQILKTHQKDPILETTQKPDLKKEVFLKLPSVHIRSKSDELSSIKAFEDSLSPNSVLLSPKLVTIFSGKEEKFETEVVKKQRFRKRKKEKRIGTKSLTDLEFEELKGFMDLGFVFSEDDVDSNLVEILPGLQKLGKKEENLKESENKNESLVQRPYLSEAWKNLEKNEKINSLNNWKIKDLSSEFDMKQSLKWWAHSVASTVV